MSNKTKDVDNLEHDEMLSDGVPVRREAELDNSLGNDSMIIVEEMFDGENSCNEDNIEVEMITDDDQEADRNVEEDVLDLEISLDPDVIGQNDILSVTTSGWAKDWGEIVKDEKNLFKKDVEVKNYDPMRNKVEGHEVTNKYRKAQMVNGQIKRIPGRYLEEQGLLMEKGKGGQKNRKTRRYNHFMEFGSERLEVVRKKSGKPEVIQTSNGPLFEPSFTKPGVIAQYREVISRGLGRLDSMDEGTIQGLEIEKGKEMLKQMDEFLEWMDEEIIPTTPANLQKAIKNMAVLKIKFANKAQHEFEYFNVKGDLVIAKSPPLADRTLKEKRKELEKWMIKNVVPVLNKWSEDLIMKLPEGMEALATFVGVDMEGHAVQKRYRGPCIQCGKSVNNHRTQGVHLIHFCHGTGTFFISLEGLGGEGMQRIQPGAAIIPEKSTPVPLTDHELEMAENYRIALDIIIDLFFNEDTASLVPIAFDARNAERKLLKEMQEVVFGRCKGYRIGESSLKIPGSLPNLSMQDVLYDDEGGAKDVRSASGIQSSLIHERRMTGGLYKNAEAQGTLTLKDIGEQPEDVRNRDLLLYILYNKEDSTLCRNAIILAVISVVLQSPLLLATGGVKFLREFCEMLPELVARSTVINRVQWKVGVDMLPLNRVVTEVLAINTMPGLKQIIKYRKGAFAEFGIPEGTKFCKRPRLYLKKSKSSKKVASEPDVADGSKKSRKAKGGPVIQDNQTMWGDPGIVCHIGETSIMESIAAGKFDISEPVTVSANAIGAQKRGGDLEEIDKDVERRADEPHPKRQVIFRDDEGTLVKNKNQNLSKVQQLLPNADDIVEVLRKKSTLTSDEAKELIERVQAKVDTANKRGILTVDKKTEEAMKSQRKILNKVRDVETMKDEFNRNKTEIERLQKRQDQLTTEMRDVNIEIMKLRKQEADRKAKELGDMVKRQEDIGKKAMEGGVILIAEIRAKDSDSENAVAVEQPTVHRFAPLYERVIPNHLPDRAPLELRQYEQEFLKYVVWRWSFIELVRVILAILDSMNDAVIEFEGTPPKEAKGNQPAVEGTGKRAKRFQHGAFLGVAELQKARNKATQKGVINYHHSRKLVAIVETLAKLHLEDREVSDDEEIKDDDKAAKRAEKVQANLDRGCKRYLKIFAARFSEACREVTKQEVAVPWACQAGLVQEHEKRFVDMANSIVAEKRAAGKMWTEIGGRHYLEVKVTTFIHPTASAPMTGIIGEAGGEVRDERVDEERNIQVINR